MIKKEYKYSEITSEIIGCAMNVHNILGNGFQEVIYQRCLAIEMEEHGLKFVRELDISIFIKREKLEQGVLIFLSKIKLWLN